MADDETVLRTGRPLLDRFELWYNDQHILDWFVTTKLPLFDSQGRLIGLVGPMRSYEGQAQGIVVVLQPYAGRRLPLCSSRR